MIVDLRRQRFAGQQIARDTGVSPATASRVLRRAGHRVTGDRRGQSNRRGTKLGGMGWEYVHVCIDDASRVAYYASLGVTVERVMTDNGACYKSKAFRHACQHVGLRHIRTKPYTPKTNGKAERFIQTALREWTYASAYKTSKQRAQQLPA
jgi:transposase InsO family protein